jgi:hypothetical protein
MIEKLKIPTRVAVTMAVTTLLTFASLIEGYHLLR